MLGRGQKRKESAAPASSVDRDCWPLHAAAAAALPHLSCCSTRPAESVHGEQRAALQAPHRCMLCCCTSPAAPPDSLQKAFMEANELPFKPLRCGPSAAALLPLCPLLLRAVVAALRRHAA